MPSPVCLLCVAVSVLVISARAQDEVVFHVYEEEQTRTTVGNIIDGAKLFDVYSEDVLSQLRFRFREPHSLFDINESTGVILTRRVIDREDLVECMFESQCVFDLEVTVTPYSYFRVIKITIYVDDINDHTPEFAQPRVSLNIPENVARNTSYTLPVAEDLDSEALNLDRYELVTQTDQFGISVNVLPDGTKDLNLVVLKPLDSEKENYYSLEIQAIDKGNPPKVGTVSVDITVGESNDNSPVFDKDEYSVRIYENLEPGTPVLQVSARDPDQSNNGMILFEFDRYTQTESGAYFSIDNRTGLISVTGQIDFETQQVFQLNIAARDLGSSNSVSDFAKVTVNVLDVNDNPPLISVNTFTDGEYARVPENVEAGHTVAYVGVSDPDTGPGGNVSCGIDNGFFRMSGRSNPGSSGFEVVSAQPFDREQQEEYTLLIHCEDQGSPRQSSSVMIPITVTDKNDNDPQFVPNTPLFAVSIPENNKIGDVIMKVNATDRDAMENAAIRYTIESLGDTPQDAVSIDLITGIIRALIEFDYEQKDFYQFRIIATDQGSPARLVDTLLNLNILDTNDGLPHFVLPAYTFNVKENQVAKTRVGEVAAVDSAAAPFNQIVYSLQPGRDSYKFHIDPETGVLVTSTILDREESTLYELVGVASNEGAPEIQQTVNITVHVDDMNDNPPVILFPTDKNNTIQVPTRMDIGYHVTQIEAMDPDDYANSQLRFDISSGNEGRMFQVDPETGAIFTAAAMDMANLKSQTLVIKVKDSGVPEKVTFASLNVVFNSSVAEMAGLLRGDTLTLLIVAAVGGCVFIVIVIAVAVCCIRRSRDKRDKDEHVYNCRAAEEAKKAMANGDRVDSAGDILPEKCVDTSISKTKEKSKKEVTFSVDMDDGWATRGEKAVIENPHAQHIDPSDCRPPPPERQRTFGPQTPGLVESAPRGGRPVSRQNSCCTCAQKHDPVQRLPPPLTQQNLDMLEYTLWHGSVDRDSESGCSGTDSGRGPSEEGEYNHHHHHQQHPHGTGGADQGGHDHCHGNCCCSSGIYAKKYNQPYGYQPGPPPRGCSCCGPPPVQNTYPHGCGPRAVSPGHDCSGDECTPLEALPPFGRYHHRGPMYPRPPRSGYADCRGPSRHRLALDPDEMAKHRQYGYAPSLPSLTDRHTPSPTFTSNSDSQYYPYTGAHNLYPKPRPGAAFMPIVKKSPSRDDERSPMTVSDDGTSTTMSGSYSMDNIREVQEPPPPLEGQRLDGQVGDCFV